VSEQVEWWCYWKRLRGWRTIILNLTIAIGFTIAEMLDYLAIVDWRDFIDPRWAPWVVVAINLMNIAIRQDTRGPSGYTRWRERRSTRPRRR
jgi:hypothetical protein